MRIIYGINPVKELLEAGGAIEVIKVSERADVALKRIMARAAQMGIPVEKVAQKDLDRFLGSTKHQGVAAVMAGEFKYKNFNDLISIWKNSKENALFLILDSIQDPQNFGALIRSAEAAGVHGIIIPKDRACEVTPVVTKASAGAIEHVAIARETNLNRVIEDFKKENVWVAGVEAGCKDTIYTADLDRDLAIVIGSEGKGIRRLVMENCDFCVSIPMAGKVNSLNAAQAGSIALFEAKRQRMKK